MHHDTFLVITDENKTDYAALTSVEGDLVINAQGATLPALASIEGDLIIHAQGTALPALSSIGNDLVIHAQEIALPALASVEGDMIIRIQGAALPALASVGGDVIIHAQEAALPALNSVGGYLSIKTQGIALPALAKVGSEIYVCAEETSLPALVSICGEPFTPPTPEVVQKRLAAVARAALAREDALDMTDFHRCNTVHCVAGWGIHNEGEAGYALERRVGSHNAGLMLLGVGAASRFYMKTEAAREWLRTWLPEAAPTAPG